MVTRSLGPDRGGRGFGSGVLALLFVAACTEGGPGPVADPSAAFTPPEVGQQDGVRVVANRSAPERLRVYRQAPESAVRLLFIR